MGSREMAQWESLARLSLMCHMWVFLLVLTLSQGFFSGYSGFPHSWKTNIKKTLLTSVYQSSTLLGPIEAIMVNICLQCYINTRCLFPNYMCTKYYRFHSLLWGRYFSWERNWKRSFFICYFLNIIF